LLEFIQALKATLAYYHMESLLFKFIQIYSSQFESNI